VDVTKGNSDASQRRRLARLLQDPAEYFAAARRAARERAHRSVTEQIEGSASRTWAAHQS
jgi:hypothetical protein